MIVTLQGRPRRTGEIGPHIEYEFERYCFANQGDEKAEELRDQDEARFDDFVVIVEPTPALDRTIRVNLRHLKFWHTGTGRPQRYRHK
ncbi:MAG: hypothetical protein ABIR70_08455 [Bryobacteraceae bacterium]